VLLESFDGEGKDKNLKTQIEKNEIILDIGPIQ
jgi:hypothetical protein